MCNWAVVDGDGSLCLSCRLTRVIPDLSLPGVKQGWYRLETAKRRLVYTLDALRLPLASRTDDQERGLAFEFLADPPDGSRVMTGHASGVITISLAGSGNEQGFTGRWSIQLTTAA